MGWTGIQQNGILNLIFLAVIIPPLAAQRSQSNEGCPGAAGTSCDAFSTLKIEVTSGGCEGESGASCGALAESKTVIREALTDWLGGNDRCDAGGREVAATIVAQAVAEVWTSAFSRVSCAGQGFACGFSAANGKAWAEGLSESIAQGAADAEAGTQFCYADVRALAGVFSESLSQSQTEVCTSNGDAESFLALYQKTVETKIAESFAAANAEACALGRAQVAAQSLCTDGEFALGDVCGGITQNKCDGDGKEKCCDPKFKRRVCRCERCKGPWIRRSVGEPRWFENQAGVRCRCPATDRQPPPKSPPSRASPPQELPAAEGFPPSAETPSTQTSQKPSSPKKEETPFLKPLPAKTSPATKPDISSKSLPPKSTPPKTSPATKPEISPKSLPKKPPPTPPPERASPPAINSPSPESPPPAVPSPPSRPPPKSCYCSNVQPPQHTCTQQRDWGKCNEYWMLKEGYCEETCGRCYCPDSCHCTNVPPPGSRFTCEQQKEFGKCNEGWMVYAPISGGYCQESCGRCPCQDDPQKFQPEIKSKPDSRSCTCTDNPIPNDPYTCEQQRSFGKCGEEWLLGGDFCKTSCGRCECPGSPSPPKESKADKRPYGCICSDEPPPKTRFSCAQQSDFGKCDAHWMKRTNVFPEGFCQITCGRCPCKNPKLAGKENKSNA